MRVPCIFIILLGWISVTYAQSDDRPGLIDSLDQQLELASPQSRIAILQQIGKLYQPEDPGKAITYYRRAASQAKVLGDSLAWAGSVNSIGVAFYFKSDFDSSTQYYYRALALTQDKPEHYLLRTKIHNNIAWNYQKKDDLDKALENYKNSAEYMSRLENDTLLGLLLNNVGTLLRNMEKYDSALHLLRRSIILNRRIGNTDLVIYNLNNLGVAYMNLEKPDSARYYFTEALGYNYLRRDTIEIVNNLQNIGVMLMSENRMKAAEDTLLKVLALTELRSVRLEDARWRALENISELMAKTGRYEQALAYYKERVELKDDLYRQELSAYEVEHEYLLEAVQREKELQETRAEAAQQRLYIAVIVLSLVIALIVIFTLARFNVLRRRNETKLMRLNQEVNVKAKQLRKVNKEVTNINRNLETIVEKRTATIIENNKKLKEFAYMNAHRIRAPLASLLGLLDVFKMESTEEEKKYILGLIRKTASDMDKVIKEVGKRLDNAEVDDMEDFEENSSGNGVTLLSSPHKTDKEKEPSGSH